MGITDWGLGKRTRQSSIINLYLLLLVCTILMGCQQQDVSWQRVQEAGVLRVGIDPTYPPFEFDVDGELQGIDVDLAHAIGQDLGVEVAFVWFGYDGLYDALATDQVDVLISGMVIVPERMRDFAYSEPYFNAGEILVVPAGVLDIREMADLNGRSLAVELGAQGHVEATVWQRNLGNLTILPQETADAALTAVLQNQADAALADAISVHLFLGEHEGVTAVAPAVTVEPFAMVVRQEDQTLLTQLNNALDSLRTSGALDQILQRWFNS